MTKETLAMYEAIMRIEALKTELEAERKARADDVSGLLERIAELEAALKEIAAYHTYPAASCKGLSRIARKALEKGSG